MKKLIKHKVIGAFVLGSFVFGTALLGVMLMPEKVNSTVSVPCPDFTGDNWVSLSDFSLFVDYYNNTHDQGQKIGFNKPADFDQDKDVDDDDLAIFQLYYNGPFTCGVDSLVNLDTICPDFNQDYVVNLSDFTFFGEYYDTQNLLADFDGDGDVDEMDQNIFEMFYNTDCICADYPV